jgi:hypothetical protein
MKAKEYAERYKAEGSTDEALVKVWVDMFNEVLAISKTRNAIINSACIAIVYEINDKWKAFARLAGPEVLPEGFMLVLQYEYPNLWDAMKAYEAINGGDRNGR